MIRTLLDACRFVLAELGEASQVMEMKLWRASESEVRAALDEEIEEHGESSLFVMAGEDEYGLRSWTAD